MKDAASRQAYVAIYGRPLGGETRRRKPNAVLKQRIIEHQGNACLYCDLPIGTKVTRRGKPVTLRLNWDHFIPHAYVAVSGPENWVISCHVCNAIKHSKIFGTVIEAQMFIRPRWLELGYEHASTAALPVPDAVQEVAQSGVDSAVLYAAERIADYLRRNRRVLPESRVFGFKFDADVTQAALDFLVFEGRVARRTVDGKAICSLLKTFRRRRYEVAK